MIRGAQALALAAIALGAMLAGCDALLGIGDYTFHGTGSSGSAGGATGSSTGGAGRGGNGDNATSGSTGGAGGTTSASGGAGGSCCDCDGDGHDAVGPCGGDDCDDGDARVHPGQMAFFKMPAAGGGYDFDCNGTEEPEFAAINCGALPLVNCDATQTGLEIALACGETGAWGHCTVNLTSCQFMQTGQRTQGCR